MLAIQFDALINKVQPNIDTDTSAEAMASADVSDWDGSTAGEWECGEDDVYVVICEEYLSVE